MKSGALREVITIEHCSEGVNDYGSPEAVWVPLAVLRGEVITATAGEYIAGAAGVVIFRARFLAGLTVKDRVSWRGGVYPIREIVEHGREALELRCERTAL